MIINANRPIIKSSSGAGYYVAKCVQYVKKRI